MLSRLVEIYLAQNVLLLLSGMLVALTHLMPRQPSPAQRLGLAYALLAASVLAPLIAPQRVPDSLLPVTAQIWSALPPHSAAGLAPFATISVPAAGAQLPLSGLAALVLACCLGGVAIAVVRIGQGVRAALAVLAESLTVRRAGALRVLVSGATMVPFSFWLPGRCFIVVPVALLEHAARLRHALRHEAQHHRQGDTRLLYVLQLLAGAFFLNPAIHLLRRHISAQQELACDAAAVGSEDPRAYCDCLLWIAERTLAQQPGLHVTAGMGRSLLHRRVAVLLGEPRPRLSRGAAWATAAAMAATVIMTGVALAGTIQDRRIDATQAQAMAARAQAGSSFPIVMNAQVLRQLNQLLGTQSGRASTRESLQRMHAQESVVAPHLEKLRLPLELKAIPIIESGYRNRRQDAKLEHGAGLWMFIAPTARRFGLKVDGTADERMNAALESDAAARLLAALYSQMGDWRLVLLAFNAGDQFVQRAIKQEGTRDAFRLTQLGHENDPGYLARVMAAIIIVKNEDQLSL